MRRPIETLTSIVSSSEIPIYRGQVKDGNAANHVCCYPIRAGDFLLRPFFETATEGSADFLELWGLRV